MSNLETELNKIRQKEDEIARKEALINKELENAKMERIKLQNKADDIISKAKEEANNIINKTKEDSKKLIDEIKNMSQVEFKEHEMASLKHKVKSLEEIDTDNLDDYEFQVGDYVFIKSYEKYGTISAKRKGKFVVNVGQFAMEFASSELKLSAKPKPKPVKETHLSGYNPASHCALSLDLRGKRYEEVKPLMDQYLDQALLGNLESVTIIHGFGTGAIRKAVQEYLKNCSFVKSYRYGKEGEGLNGVTVVFLK
jgi:DNA mismatch repair protein MutS2